LLLVSIFEKFRETARASHKLEILKSYTLPGFSWQCLLHSFKDIEIDNEEFSVKLIQDIDTHSVFKKSIRGGISQVSKRYAKEVPKNDDGVETRIYDFDANNLYGWAMMQMLPYEILSPLNEDEVKNITEKDIINLNDDGNTGYQYVIDCYVPKEFHDKLSDLPPCPENKIPPNDLGKWQQEYMKKHDIKMTNCKKLMCDFIPKTYYSIHYKLLKLFIKLGLKITRIHTVYPFKQCKFMKDYIVKNTELRKRATSHLKKTIINY
jgi:hypothetical protein